MIFYRYDQSGFFVETISEDEAPDDATQIMFPKPYYNPRWTGTQWIEGSPPPDYNPDIEIIIWDNGTKKWRVEPKPSEIIPLEDQLRALRIFMGVEP